MTVTDMKVKSRGDKKLFRNILGLIVKDWATNPDATYLHAEDRDWIKELVKAFHHITED